VIAVVQGEARGFGCALVGQCDLAIASTSAEFSMPEMDGNLPPTLAISAVLGKVPPKPLMDMVLLRSRISARRALEIGLLSDLCEAGELETRIAETVARLKDRSRPALCAVKEYMSLAPYMDPAGAARLGANLLSVVLSSPREG
jgi:enoyl-CoA hydratase